MKQRSWLLKNLPGGGAGGAWGTGGRTCAAAGGRGACAAEGGDGALKRQV